MSTIGFDHSLPTRRNIPFAAGGGGNRYEDGSREGMFRWKEDPYGRIALILILLYMNKFATNEQMVDHPFGRFGISSRKVLIQLLKWLPGFDAYFLRVTGKPLTEKVIYGRMANMFRDNTTKQPAIGKEHPINHRSLALLNTLVRYRYWQSGEDEHFLDDVDLCQLVRDADAGRRGN